MAFLFSFFCMFWDGWSEEWEPGKKMKEGCLLSWGLYMYLILYEGLSYPVWRKSGIRTHGALRRGTGMVKLHL